MRYFEFNDHEYYALIKADDLQEAYEKYVDLVSKDEEISQISKPDEVTQLEAFNMFSHAVEVFNSEVDINTVIELFYQEKDLVLVDEKLSNKY